MPKTLPPAPSSTILFEGDSLTRFAGKPSLDTWAWMRMTGAHVGYPDKVGDWIFCHRPDLKLTLHTGAIGGSILADVLERFPAITAVYKPAIVVMTIGINDVNRGVTVGDFRRQGEEYCRKLQDLCGGRVMYLGNLRAAHGAGPDAPERFARAKPYSDALSEVVTAHGGLAVDLGTVLERKGAVIGQLWAGHTLYHDGTHFNPVGNEIVAGVVLRALGLMATPGDPDSPA
jgi:lysophospholipase L1-like esterase